MAKNQEPWFIVEVKSSDKEKLSPNLDVFRQQLQIDHVFQVSVNGDYVNSDVFSMDQPVIIPAKTFLSQLV